MAGSEVWASLILMDKTKAKTAIINAYTQYVQLIADIYNDIYDSCIALYYSQYMPTQYDRHGDLSGFNLYQATDIYVNDLYINLALVSEQLLPYKGKKDKRYSVLNSVINGLRGAKSRKSPPGWPMSWSAYYPNEFSQHSEWGSSETTLQSILKNFGNNGPKDLVEQFYIFLTEYID